MPRTVPAASGPPSVRARARAFTLIEAVLAIALVALLGVLFSAAYPVAARAQARARYRAVAVRVARREMEALRQVGYDRLASTTLLAGASPKVLDDSVAAGQSCAALGTCTFSTLSTEGQDAVSQALPGGRGDFAVADARYDQAAPANDQLDLNAASGSGLRRITVRVRWTEYGNVTRSVTLVSLVSYTQLKSN